MSTIRRNLLLAVIGLLLFAGGVLLGRSGRSSSTSVAESATMDESAGLDLTKHEVVQKEPTTKVVTRIVYRDGPVQERIVEREVAGGSTATTDTHTVATETRHETVKEVVKVDDRPYRAGILFAVHPGGTLYGAYAGVRLIGPVEVTGMAAGGAGWMAGVGLGVRF
jgi:hypothetical protein